jgi:hypothetical protein
MNQDTVVTAHKSAVASDPNNKLDIAGTDVGPGGAPTTYLISHADGPGHEQLVFQTLDRAGLTNEALLAIVSDRLFNFQAGPFACAENGKALGHVNEALVALRQRTVRRHEAGLEGKMAETKEEVKHRVHCEAYKLVIGDKVFDLDDLKMWRMWDKVLAAVKVLDPELSPLELTVIENAAAHLGGGARNGLTEFKSALSNMRAAKK